MLQASFSVLASHELALQAVLYGILSESRRCLKKVGGMIGWLGDKNGVGASQCIVGPIIVVYNILWATLSITFAYRLFRVWWLLGVVPDCCSVSDCTPHAQRHNSQVHANAYRSDAVGLPLCTPHATRWPTSDTKKMSFRKVLGCCSVSYWLLAWTTNNKKNVLQKSVLKRNGCNESGYGWFREWLVFVLSSAASKSHCSKYIVGCSSYILGSVR